MCSCRTLEWHLRDIVTLNQHVIAQQKVLEVVGGLWLDDADVQHPLIAQRVL